MASGLAVAALGLTALSLLGAMPALAQKCPEPLASARRLVLVTTETMNATAATLQLFERDSTAHPWRAAATAEPAVIGRAGMGWSHFFRQLARAGEPIKVEGDKRAPAGIYPIGRSFGTLASSRPDHLQVTGDTVCVYEPASPAYNRITSRAGVAPGVNVENMSRMLPMYRRGLVVDYPTDGRARAGSCIFIHVWRSPTTGTAGCVALSEARVEALQDFSTAGAVIAILPRAALGRLPGCLPSAGRT
jgi:L,D-peptidoglycan transpeptidase YkuD (ErfK/YbiS/YcfS/YnhG family)